MKQASSWIIRVAMWINRGYSYSTEVWMTEGGGNV
jgi:hypothetical protein